MKRQQAAQAIIDKMRENHGITVVVEWIDYNNTVYPTGIKGQCGHVKVSAIGYKTTEFTFTSDDVNGWRLTQ